MKNYLLITLCCIQFHAFCQNYFHQFKDLDKQSVSIVGDDFTVEVEIIKPDNERKIKVADTRSYSWFINNQIQTTQGGYDSKLLHGNYVAKYLNKSLKEKGIYKYGLKKGVWKQWYENGNLKSITHWKAGQLNGKFIQYTASNELSKTGKYKAGKLSGTIIEYTDGQVAAIDKFVNGVKQIKKEKKTPEKTTKKVTNTKKTPSSNKSADKNESNFKTKLKAFFTPKKKTTKKDSTEKKSTITKSQKNKK